MLNQQKLTTGLGRNVVILSLCQALGSSGIPLVILAGGIVGAELAPASTWATLPIALAVIGSAFFTIPAALVMKRIGRKRSFIIAATVAAAAAAAAAFAIAIQSFLIFCIMMVLLGGSAAFVQQYRFAAAESVEHVHVGRAISFVLAGGIVAGFLGPQIGRNARDWLGYGAYSGSFIVLAVLYAVSVFLLLFIKNTSSRKEDNTEAERPLRKIVVQPIYLAAVFSSAVAFGVMAFIMSSTPLSMHVTDHFPLNDTALVIQSHIIAMYLPSLFSGFLLERLGIRTMQITGIILMSTGVIVAASGHNFFNYLASLISIGIGWNFLFVAGTVMLTQSYHQSERFKAQGVNDFAIYTFQSLVVLTSGAVFASANWEILNLVCLPFLLVTLFVVLATHRGRDNFKL